jgi:N-acetylneuraminic acid mutarotase
VANGSGTVNGAVNNVQISCPQPRFSVGGSVTGLVVGSGDTLEIQDNAGDNLFVTGDVPFTFPTQFSYGTTYSVTGFLPPTSQTQGCNIFFATALVVGNVSNVLVDCQHNDWAWMFPGPTPSIDTYGTAGLPVFTGANPIPTPPIVAPNPDTPGGRDFAMAWTDTSGNRWLFGGFGFEVNHINTDGVPGYLNDMWVWPTTANTGNDDGWWLPGAWIPSDLPIICDSTGCFADITTLQLRDLGANYGGAAPGTGTICGYSAGTLANCTRPGARWGGITWTDPVGGNLWMFGGQGIDSNGNFTLLNDVWEFDITSAGCGWDMVTGTGTFTNCKWVWESGSSTGNQSTTAGFPGGRWGAASYADTAGNVWMFGGQGYDSAGTVGLLNDLWKYNIAAKTWTLVSGGSVLSNVNGSYGTQGTGAAGNVPGGRQTAVLWADATGKIWLFGGFGLDSAGTSGGTGQIGSVLNDLWKYDPITGFWTWVSGSNTANQKGVYPTQAISNATLNEAASSVPGSRWGSAGWVSPDNGNLFLVGGFGYGNNSTVPTGFLNDVWEYDIAKGQWIWWKGSTDVNQPSTYITTPVNFFQLSYTNNQMGARRGAARWLPNKNGFVYMFGGEGYAGAGGPYGHLNDVWRYLPFP